MKDLHSIHMQNTVTDHLRAGKAPLSHFERILRCKSRAGAARLAHKLTKPENLTHYRHATAATIAQRGELIPPDTKWQQDRIPDNSIGRAFRMRYSRILVNIWARRHKNNVVNDAYTLAMDKIQKDLDPISPYAAWQLLRERMGVFPE